MKRIACLALLLCLPTTAGAAQLYFFGDSLTDDGGAFGTFALAPQFGGQPFPPSPPYADGRYSNGPMWSERVADSLGAPSPVDRNFAIGGATSRVIDDPDDPLQTLASFGGQIALFESTFGAFSPDDLAFVNFGGNDIPLIGRLAAAGGPSIDEGIEASVDAISAGVRRLGDLGARDVTVLGYPDLALTPFVARDPAAVQADFGVTPGELSTLTADFNTRLREDLATLAATETLRITVVDLFTPFAAIAADPDAFGFGPLDEPCLLSRSTALTAQPNPTRDCTDPHIAATTLFWDVNFHPTAAGQQLIADSVIAARSAPAIPLPPAGLLLGVALAGALAFLRRGKNLAST